MVDENETPDEAEAEDGSEAGRPRDPDELDPDLISLARPRGTVGPLLSLSIIVFCVYIIVRLFADYSFSRKGDTPKKIHSLDEISAGESVSAEDFVAVRAVPDHSFVVHLAGAGSRYGHRIAPVLGSDAKLWVLVEATPWAAKPVYHNIRAGRLRRLQDLPFAESLRDYVKRQPAAERFVTAQALHEALATNQSSVVDAFGDTLPVTPDTPVIVAEAVLDRVRIEAFRTSFPDDDAARAALTAAGVLTGTEPATTLEEMFVFKVEAPEGLAAVRARLAASKQFGARAEPVVLDHITTWEHLSARKNGVSIARAPAIPLARLSSISVTVSREVPADAMVLLTNERPGAYWYMLPLYVVLGVFVLLFLWALIQYFRRDAGATPPAPAEGAAS